MIKRYMLVSACLLGVDCKYNGENNLNETLVELYKKGEVISVCPEYQGGLDIPRAPAEIQGASGEDVLDRRCRVITTRGEDVTEQFVRGAEMALETAQKWGATIFIGKQRSPSCGCGQTYDGIFKDKVIKGDGVTTALLKRHGLDVITEEDL